MIATKTIEGHDPLQKERRIADGLLVELLNKMKHNASFPFFPVLVEIIPYQTGYKQYGMCYHRLDFWKGRQPGRSDVLREELIDLQLMIFSLIAIGLLVKKIGMVGKTGQKNLTDLVVNLILPCNIVESFMVEFSPDIAADFTEIFLISLLIQIGCVLLGHLLFRRTTEGRRKCPALRDYLLQRRLYGQPAGGGRVRVHGTDAGLRVPDSPASDDVVRGSHRIYGSAE